MLYHAGWTPQANQLKYGEDKGQDKHGHDRSMTIIEFQRWSIRSAVVTTNIIFKMIAATR